VVLSLAASGALAAGFTYNFDDGTNPFTAYSGTPVVTTDQAHSGTQSLYFSPTGSAAGRSSGYLDLDFASGGGLVTMWMFDRGAWCDGNEGGVSANGWRLGLTGSAQFDWAGISTMQRSYMGSAGGYAYSMGNGDGGTFGGWYSPWWSAISRQVVSLSPTPNDGSSGVGAWSKWGFEFGTDGNVAIFMYDANDQPIASSMVAYIPEKASSIFVYGGSAQLGGVYIDDVTWTPNVPEPATISLLAIGGVLALVRRNRK